MTKQKFLAVLLCLCCAAGSAAPVFAAGINLPASDTKEKPFRAMWVSTVVNLDFPSRQGLSAAEMRAEIDATVARAADIGLTALLVQVRPASDALYPSDLYPWSEYLTGTQGAAPPDGFDPLAYWVARGHGAGLQVHAWLNPFRITRAADGVTDVSQLAANHPARLNPSWAISYKGAFYFDPGNPACRQYIADGVTEILRNYDVDGIHLDDYFYPDHSADFPDQAMYAAHGGGTDIADWRRENVNALVRLLRDTVHREKPGARFGISPFAIWQNAQNDPLGSDTRGNESYSSHYADTRRWALEGWLDYICPQIYWAIGYEIADYAKILAWWEGVAAQSDVDLYIGHAAYREEEGAEGWNGEMARQLKLNAASPVVKGDAFFRAKFLNGTVGEAVKAFYLAADTPVTVAAPAPPAVVTPSAVPPAAPAASVPVTLTPANLDAAVKGLGVAQPARDVTVSGVSGYNFFGAASPAAPVYVNGQEVTNRTAQGFFSVYMPLESGKNTFTFTQSGQSPVTRTVTLGAGGASAPTPMQAPAVMNAFPASEEMGGPGETVTLRCTAPAGAAVTAVIGGVTVPLSQSGATPADGVYPAAFSASYTLPAADAAAVTSLGNVQYTAAYKGGAYTAASAKPVRVIGPAAPYYATVSADAIWLFGQPSASGGSNWSVTRGQRDRITAVTDGWVRLACGGWLEADAITTALDAARKPAKPLGAGYVTATDTETTVRWPAEDFPAVYAGYDGDSLVMRVGLLDGQPLVTAVPGGMVQNVMAHRDGEALVYTFTLHEGARLEGYYTDYADGELRLHLKTRRALAAGDAPLTDFHIVVDAGHGDDDSGAVGPLGARVSEKTLNLINARKLAERLRQLGARVTMVRDTDVFHTLYERSEVNRKANPDLFISIHGNSMPETTNADSIRGLTVWYRNAPSLPFAEALGERLSHINPGTTRKQFVYQSNFYVCRPVVAPSVIIETSFLCNIHDFEWLVDEARQNELAMATAEAVVAYFR